METTYRQLLNNVVLPLILAALALLAVWALCRMSGGCERDVEAWAELEEQTRAAA
jgi:hypothetical protein